MVRPQEPQRTMPPAWARSSGRIGSTASQCSQRVYTGSAGAFAAVRRQRVGVGLGRIAAGSGQPTVPGQRLGQEFIETIDLVLQYAVARVQFGQVGPGAGDV